MIKSAREFVKLRNSERPEEYLRSANEAAQTDVWLEVLKGYPSMKVWVAHNKTIPIEILEILAEDPDPEVRRAVAMKNKLPAHLMTLLATDVDGSVRERIAYNKNAGEAVLQKLVDDPYESISAVARHRVLGMKG